MDNTTIADRLKAIEEGLRLQKKVFNTTDLHRYTGLSKSTIYMVSFFSCLDRCLFSLKILFKC